MPLNPFQILQQQMKDLGAELTAGVITAQDRPTMKATVTLADGSVITNVPMAGGRMTTGKPCWLIKNGTTLIAIGAVVPAITFSTSAPTGVADVGSIHFNTTTWAVYSYV